MHSLSTVLKILYTLSETNSEYYSSNVVPNKVNTPIFGIKYMTLYYYTRIIVHVMLTGGVDTASTDGTYDVSNADRLGFSEVELVQKVVDGVELLIKVSCNIVLVSGLYNILLIQMEKKLEVGEPIEDLIPK